MNKSV